LAGWIYKVRQAYSPVLYIGRQTWSGLFGNGYRPTNDFVLWLTGCHTNDTCDPGTAGSCRSRCNPRGRAKTLWSTGNLHATALGGQHPVLWQFHIDADYDLAIQDAHMQFSPRSSSRTYASPAC